MDPLLTLDITSAVLIASLLCAASMAQPTLAASASSDAPSQGNADQAPQHQASKHLPTPGPRVLVHARELYNRATRYAHSMPEVPGPEITVTKKTTVVKLDDQPPIIDNHERELFDRMPGIVLAEQQNPTELNVTYRGLGNPQESEYILLMQDGIPMEMDWIGYPTLYYIPVPETISEVQMIRGGSGLLYGPEPEPVINFVSKMPTPTTTGTVQQVGGSDGLYSTFDSISGPAGPVGYLADFEHRQSNGQRANGDYNLNSGDADLDYHIDSHQTLTLAVHAYSLESGMAGFMNYAQFEADPNQTATPDDHDWESRYTGVLTYSDQFDSKNLYVQKLWLGYQDLITRADGYVSNTAPLLTAPPVATSATVASQRFHYTGLDGRFLHRYGRGAALTVGYTVYTSDSPYDEIKSPDPEAAAYDPAGTPIYDDQRRSRYAAVFAENLYRFKRIHVVISARFNHEQIDSHETVAQHPYLVNGVWRKNIPLFGFGIGNDFGHGNETYLNISQGFRPVRYLDVASPFGKYSPTNNPEPTKYLTYEAGVHGWPITGFYYDASVFQINVKNSIETEAISPVASIDINTGNSRSRGVEAETSYDLFRLWPSAPDGAHLSLFANATYLNAVYTASILGLTGKTPPYAPNYVLKGGLTLTEEPGLKLSLIVDAVGSQFFQDTDLADNGTPARIPAYTVVDLSGEYKFAGHWRVLGGISNLTNQEYYSRVFLSAGEIEPALSRQFYAGVAYDL
jgi:Fe(3+) dicitrate transport protein